MIPFSSVTIGGLPFDAYDISKEKVLEATRQIGMTIIEGKKSTEFGIGRALTEMAACILRDEKKIMPRPLYYFKANTVSMMYIAESHVSSVKMELRK